MTGLKSSYEITLDKMKNMDIDDVKKLTDADKNKIANIKKEYEAKIAEKKILLSGHAELNNEVSFLTRKRDEKIEEFYNELNKVK